MFAKIDLLTASLSVPAISMGETPTPSEEFYFDSCIMFLNLIAISFRDDVVYETNDEMMLGARKLSMT